jgi:hypothetical protein
MRHSRWLETIRAVLIILIILDLLSLPISVLQLFNGAYPIGTVFLEDVFPQGFGKPVPVSLGRVELMWHPTGAFQILMFGLSMGLGFIVATLPMLGYAYRVTGHALHGDPFTMEMVGKLRKLGLLIIVGGLVSQAAAFVAGEALLRVALADEPGLRAGAYLEPARYLSFWWLLPGLLVLAFAEIVRRGCQLRAELDGVI